MSFSLPSFLGMLILTGRELYYLPLESGVLRDALNVLRLLTPRLTCINIVHSISSEDASETPPKTYTSRGRSHRSIETHWCLSLSNLPVCGQLQLLACVFSCKGSLVSNQNAVVYPPIICTTIVSMGTSYHASLYCS